MAITRSHNYAPIVAGSTYVPLTIELRDGRTGQYLDLTGATVTITVIDERTNEVIVESGEAAPNETNPYWIEYFFTEPQAAKITAPTTWMAQWTLTIGDRKHIVPTICRVAVFPGVL